MDMYQKETPIPTILAEESAKVPGGERLTSDFWVAVRDLQKELKITSIGGPMSTLTWCAYAPSGKTEKINASHLKRMERLGLGAMVKSEEARELYNKLAHENWGRDFDRREINSRVAQLVQQLG